MVRVLVVDDQEEVRLLLVGLLSGQFEVSVAENGNQALRSMRDGHFDVMVLDLEMPELDGPGLMRALRAQGTKCPVLICSGHIDIERRAKEIGATDWIAKPFGTEALKTKLDSVLGSCPAYEVRPGFPRLASTGRPA